MTAELPAVQTSFAPIKNLVLNSVSSPLTRSMYGRALDDFYAWWGQTGRVPFDRAAVQEFRAYLTAQGLSASTVNLKLSAVRGLAAESAYAGLLDATSARGIRDVKGARREGVRTGNWLTKAQAQALMNAPDCATLKGKRDQAILATLIGCGLRREEAARLSFSHIQQRDGRWCIVDLIGKHGRVRTVPMPPWSKTAIDRWTEAAGIADGRVFRGVNKGDRVTGEALTAQGILRCVLLHANRIGVKVAPHDLRRTYARLTHRGGAKLDQIQLSLGHASLTTTERYLGVEQDLSDAPCDYLGLKLSARD